MIELTDEMRERIADALTEGYPIVVAAIAPDGQPTMSFRGTVQVIGSDRLGLWVRNREGGLMGSIAVNPKVELLYRHAGERLMWRFQGSASVVDDEALRNSIYEDSPQVERERDADRLGAAVQIDLDRVFERGQVSMER